MNNTWYFLLMVLPGYTAVNAQRQGQSFWFGLGVGLLVSGVLFGVTKGIEKVRGKKFGPTPSWMSPGKTALGLGVVAVVALGVALVLGRGSLPQTHAEYMKKLLASGWVDEAGA
ncbi:MAG: hypothetical protein AB7F66_00375 [Bacteriovoracia bacterium]